VIIGVDVVDVSFVVSGATVGRCERWERGWGGGRLEGDLLLTVREVAATMRVSTMTVYRLIKSGQLPAIRVGKNYRIRESDVDRYLSERSV
jgi:excisionase family DNA binding protein